MTEQGASMPAASTRRGSVARGVLVWVGAVLSLIVGGGVGLVLVAAAAWLFGFDVEPDGRGVHVATAAAAEIGLLAYSIVLLGGISKLGRIGVRWKGAGSSLIWSAPILIFLLPALGEINAGLAYGAALVTVALMIGLAEEVAFRGVLLDTLGGRADPVLAIWFGALLFGLAHLDLTDPVSAESLLNMLTVSLAVGVPFAVIRFVTGSLVGPIIVHGAIDSAAFLALGGFERGKAEIEQLLVGLAFGALVALLYWSAFRHRTRRDAARAAAALAASEDARDHSQGSADSAR